MIDARDFARRAAARETVRRAAELLAGAGILPAPLKGALVATRYVPDDVPRPLTDVDLLVPSSRFDEASERLLHQGGQIVGGDRDDRTVSIRVPWGPLPIDLHRRLFQRWVFRCDEAAMLGRATLDEALFGAPVLVLHRHDVIAHAIGHHAAGRPVVARDRVRTDLGYVGAGEPLDVPALAQHLTAIGLGRAVHFVARDLRAHPLPWLTELAARLPEGRLASIATDLAVRLAREPPRGGVIGSRTHGELVSISRHLVNDGFARGVVSAAIHVRQHVRPMRGS